jgi:DNA-binding NarL/FixJ family response regulator
MSTNKTQVIIADDHPILLKGLEDFLSDLGFDVIAAESNGLDTLEKIKNSKPPLAILDLEMPGLTGLEVARICKENGIDTKFILLTLHKELYFYHQAKDLNLSGYILKDFALNDLSKAIEIVLDGGTFFSEKIFEEIENSSVNGEETQLTPSEKKILRLIATGLSSKDIANKLFISERTVDKHRSNMISKLNLEKKHNALLIWAQKNRGFIE